MPSHRKIRWTLGSTRALTLCAAAVGVAASPSIASAAVTHATAPTADVQNSAFAIHETHAAQVSLAQATAAAKTAAPAAQAVKAAAASIPSSYRVKSGDTLSGIAAQFLGNGGRYTDIFNLNANKVENDGVRFTDPNLIITGWTLQLPNGSTPVPAAAAASAPAPAAAPKSTSSNTTSSSYSSSSSSNSSSSNSNSTSSSSNSGSSTTTAVASSGYADNLDGWIKQAISILNANGYYVSYNAIYQTVMHESAGNPSATNGWDINAAEGHPSIGLMQTIQPTFDAYALPGYGDIYNPVANIIAGVRYAAATYGSLDSVVAARCGGSCWYGY